MEEYPNSKHGDCDEFLYKYDVITKFKTVGSLFKETVNRMGMVNIEILKRKQRSKNLAVRPKQT